MQLAKEKDTEIKQLKEKLSSLDSKLLAAEVELKKYKAREMKLKSVVEKLTMELMQCRKHFATIQGRLKTVSATIL